MKRQCVLYRPGKNPGSVQCTCCSHYCTIGEGKSGICGVRYNDHGELYLAVWGKPSALHIDPMEKKPLYHYYPGEAILSIGTIGCNFSCKFCQNWSISMDRPGVKDIEDYCLERSEGRILTPDEIVRICKARHIRHIAATYNEPSIWFEYSYDIAQLASKEGISYVYVSNGFESQEQLDALVGVISAINIDLKTFRQETYRKIMGGSLEPVKNSIKFLYNTKKIIVEVTTLIVPDMNDSDEELQDIANFIASVGKDIPWHVSAFHPDYKMLDKKRTPTETLERALEFGKHAGLLYLYAGNVRDTSYMNTNCPQCGELLISRVTGFDGKVCNLRDGHCGKCGAPIYGKFV
ncbi:Pyruvate-formate lyase-activating enzyme lateraltransfer candidate [Giardia duodenalis assemblage B]|uniref:Pyruvate-formate lyase-activating enzyme lateraltransfer candidate n=1 Tax=Giardia duodenalis assemblage B TaxID=1394984 RepID=A0A132NZG2_GIAIN|nr:Pyruvate-formate lyase-activating enzyme lateraltransfer candidate [Giardia intestinalis assemblage B]